ncbi:hypothetical protein IWW38_002593, partial [Coemansia aciculifera]
TIAAALVKGTPQFLPGKGEFDEHDPGRLERRCKLVRALKPVDSLNFSELMQTLCLSTDYKDFTSEIDNTFTSIVDRVPVVGKVDEDVFVKHFLSVVELISACAKDHNYLPERYLTTPLVAVDTQSSGPSGTRLRPDVVFTTIEEGNVSIGDVRLLVEAKTDKGLDAHRTHIGQMADYALLLWKCQPTRTFVPVLFLHAHDLDLLVFTRRGYYVAPVGQVLHERTSRYDMSDSISKSLRRLWFLLTLPANKFGFLFDSHEFPHDVSIDTRSVPATIADASNSPSGLVFGIGELIDRPLWITGQCSYLLEANYQEKGAVLKLSWSRTNRLPEGAVYRVLEEHGVPNIPKIFASGILIENFDGYRLEFLVMRNCGTPIVKLNNAVDGVGSHIKHVASTLTEALAAGILHRDISAGNITIDDGMAYVIDWGCAKLLNPPADTSLRNEIAAK